jgi:radical SAM protein with 4Fe4S-binding SPASM domain
MKKTFKQIGEYDCLMAEVLRRNPEYAQEAKVIKDEWARHVKGPHLSAEYAAFCEKWNLTTYLDSFLDPDDLSNPIRDNPFKESPSGHVKHVLIEGYDREGNVIYRLKPNPDKVYLEIDPFTTKEVLAAKIEALISHLRTGKKKRIDTIKLDIKVFDLLTLVKTVTEIALTLNEKPDTIANAGIRAYNRITGKSYEKDAYKKLGMAEPGICDKCKTRNTCEGPCPKAEKYASQDKVPLKERLCD